MSDFPRLSSADLLARYGDDEAALRRYRMLTALMREGRPAVEVARTFGVSRESLRRASLAFSREGLDGLRSRKRGGGHFARGTPLATVIRQELDADPGVPAATLLRRVQNRMAEFGSVVPRSSFYRLISQLRDEQSTAAHGSAPESLLREALGALAEDPPLALGRSGLASLLLPDVRDGLARGRWLQRALRTAIERLRPAEAGPVLDDMRWRHYLIIAGEYEAGDTRAELQQALALSASTYSRAKREALDRLAALLPVVVAELPSPAPPTTMTSPPPPPEVFDHEPELERYMSRLRRDGLVVICGPDAVGKSAVAAVLAARLLARGQKVIWHTARPREIDPQAGYSLLLTLAAALNQDGQPGLWAQMSDPEPMPFHRWIEMLQQGLTERHWTVVLDNAHRLADLQASQVVSALRGARLRRDLRLVLVAREAPEWADPRRWPQLAPAEDAAARRIMIEQLDEQDGIVVQPIDQRIALIRDRVGDLLALADVETLAVLPADQRAAILAVLQPVEQIIRGLQ